MSPSELFEVNLKRKRLIMLVGIPGSGKTTLAKKVVEKGFHYMNADSIRLELYGDEGAQGNPEDVFAIFFQRLEQAMGEEVDIIIDNTNLNPKQRQPILERAQQFGYADVQLWLLDVPLEVCLERNKMRERNVPDDIVTNMHMELNKAGRPRRTEGKITIIRPGKEHGEFLFIAT